jgi:uncharacterized membrane protein YphA (DoxX/SURF4 family)
MVNKTAMIGQAGGEILSGQGNGELAFLYLAGFALLTIAGGGLFSLDTLVFGKTGRSSIQQKN